MLHAPHPRRERPLIYGRFNSGKSSCWLSVADWSERTDADITIHLGDTDHAWDAMRPIDGSLDRIVQVTDLDINDYRPWLDWTKKTRENVRPEDWVVVDMIDKAWTAAQGHYWAQMTGDDVLAEVYLRNQQALASKGREGEYMAGDHGANWGIINKFYNAFFQAVINMPCHVMCIAPATEVRENEKPEIRNQFKVGWKPVGQKDLPHGFHTVLFAAEATEGKWIYTTIRERGPIGQKRQMLKGEEVVGFVETYLFGVAGWRP